MPILDPHDRSPTRPPRVAPPPIPESIRNPDSEPRLPAGFAEFCRFFGLHPLLALALVRD
jgi:hypothetical protein